MLLLVKIASIFLSVKCFNVGFGDIEIVGMKIPFDSANTEKQTTKQQTKLDVKHIKRMYLLIIAEFIITGWRYMIDL